MKVFDNFFEKIYDKDIALTGMTEELFAVYVNKIYDSKKKILIVTSNLVESNSLYRSISNYVDNVYLFPMDDFLTSEAMAISPDLMVTRLETLKEVSSNKPSIVITNLMGYLRYLPLKKEYLKSVLSLKVNDEISPKELVEKLTNIGYERTTLVTKTGEIGVRGFVIDIFPLGESNPIRLEFFGDTIDSIRYFDGKSQKSLSEINSVDIYPYTEIFSNDTFIDKEKRSTKYLSEYGDVTNIGGYLDNRITIYKDKSSMLINYKQICTDMLEYREEKDIDFKGSYMFDFDDIYENNALHYLTVDNLDKSLKVINFNSKELPLFNDDIEGITKYIREKLYANYTVIVCLKDYQLHSFRSKISLPIMDTTMYEIYPNKLNLVSFGLDSGFQYKNYIFLTGRELFKNNEKVKRYKTKFKYNTKITDLNKLEIGDYVVHQINGIGIYNGLKTLEQLGVLKDYIEVLYQDNDKLYIPVEKIDMLYKYTGKEGIRPTIHKLGGQEWKKIKARVKSKVQDMANDLLRVQAERERQKGFAFSHDNELQKEFEDAFPYIATNDQLLATKQIKEDMEKVSPMDRLLVGDVGFGKTEVAFRAAFKAIMDNKQVLLLCPTTILSSQHYKNALERFKDFPVNIGLLNRFTSPRERSRIIDELREGTIDFVIGTHRILSDDIRPKDLGLLIIDEEQRFGVKHKEKLKQYKSTVDVLTLTATPIPRTLQMSIAGIRSLSLIETPPRDRYPIQTYVICYNKQLVKEAIMKEMSRDGQVFLLFNNVENIEQEVMEIENLVPSARVIYAHGRMDKTKIEDVMQQFIDHEADVLVCTTIIETGIDIPNVNTLIILDAERFGLAQLYQIRGRVGRSNKIAYCYLMYQEHKVLTETAEKRLKVIKEFTELGSGFSIATRDLSIRGAGDILGSKQAGFIDSVGIDLYLKMLNEEVERLKGNVVEEEQEDESNKTLLNVSTHISDDYVTDDDLKIMIHRMINEIDSKEKLQEVRSDLEDRFGKLNEDIIIYMYEEWFEKLVKQVGVTKVSETKNTIELYFNRESTSKLNTEDLFMNAYQITPMFRFKSRESDLTIVLDIVKLEKHPIYYLVALLSSMVN